ncbi:MAG: PQQ-binding-like beta-propeller repeat protein [Planctomycetota bacterium]|nr:PQQ-binding-like beta-propeller repeat protein [Planctomycetota bacterium]
MSSAQIKYTAPTGEVSEMKLEPSGMTSFGSGDNNHYVLQGEDIFPVHVQVQFDGRTWVFRTPSSRAPIMVNGQPRAQGRFRHGDSIVIGQYVLRFEELDGSLMPQKFVDLPIDESTTLANLLPEKEKSSTLPPQTIDLKDIDLEPLSLDEGSPQTMNLKGLVSEKSDLSSPKAFDLASVNESDEPELEPLTQDIERGNVGLNFQDEDGPAPPAVLGDVPNLPNFPDPSAGRPAESAMRLDTGELFGDQTPAHGDDLDLSNIRFTESSQADNPPTAQTGWEFNDPQHMQPPITKPMPVQPSLTPASPPGFRQPYPETAIETQQENGIRFVTDDGSDEEFVSLGGYAGGGQVRRREPRVHGESSKSQTIMTVSVVVLSIAGMLFLGYFLLNPPEKVTENPVFDDLVGAFADGRTEEASELERKFWESPYTDRQKNRVKEIASLIKIQQDEANGDHDQVIEQIEKYLSGDPNFEFVMRPIAQNSFIKLAEKSVLTGDKAAGIAFYDRAINYRPGTVVAQTARARIEALQKEVKSESSAQEKEARVRAAKQDAPGLLKRRDYQAILNQFKNLVEAVPEAANDAELKSNVRAARKALDHAQVGEIQISFEVPGNLKDLKVKKYEGPSAISRGLTQTLYLPKGDETRIVWGQEILESADEEGASLAVIQAGGVYYGVVPESGKIRWAAPHGHSDLPLAEVPLPNAPAHMLGFDGANRDLILVSSGNGTEKWRVRLKGKVTSTPTTDGKRIWLSTQPERDDDWPHRLLALDAFSGETVAWTDLPNALTCAPLQARMNTAGGERLLTFVCSQRGHVYVVGEDGKSVGGLNLEGPVVQPPIIISPFAVFLQELDGKGRVTAVRVDEKGVAERDEWQVLELSEPPLTQPSVEAALVFLTGTKGSVLGLGVEVQQDKNPVYDALKGGRSLELDAPVWLKVTEEGRHFFAAGNAVRSIEFRQFEEDRFRRRWSFNGSSGWPPFGKATSPVQLREGRVLVSTNRMDGPGKQLWCLSARTGAPLWCLAVGGGLGAKPFVDEGVAYQKTSEGRLMAVKFSNNQITLEPRDYEISRKGAFSLIASGPAQARIDGVRSLIFGNGNGQVYAIEQSTGFSRWKGAFDAGQPVVTTPCILGNSVFVSAGAKVFGLGLEFGGKEFEFTHPDNGIFLTGPILSGDRLVVGNESGEVYCLTPARDAGENFLKEVWKFDTEGAVLFAPVASGSTVLVGSSNGVTYSLDQEGRLQRRWRLGVPSAALIMDGESAILATEDRKTICLKPENDEPLWQTRLESAAASSLFVYGDSLFAGTSGGEIIQMKKNDGSHVRTCLAGRARIFGMAATSAHLLAASGDGFLYAFKLSDLATD